MNRPPAVSHRAAYLPLFLEELQGIPPWLQSALLMSLGENQQGTTAELCPLEYYKNVTFAGILGKIKYAILEFRKKI